MASGKPLWKEDWEKVREHYVRWWAHVGPVLVFSGLPLLQPTRGDADFPEPAKNLEQRYTDPVWSARNERARLAQMVLPADTLPIARVDYGTVELAACFGAAPRFAESTVWYEPCRLEPEQYGRLLLTKAEKRYRVYRDVMLALVQASGGDFIVGAPNFTPNLDTLMELRGTQNLLFDLIERPEWVKEKLAEINESFFRAFDDYYPHILADGGTAFMSFCIWGPGKTSQVQCDFAAMISPAMFREFVVPSLQAQCAWLDHSLFHGSFAVSLGRPGRDLPLGRTAGDPGVGRVAVGAGGGAVAGGGSEVGFYLQANAGCGEVSAVVGNDAG